MISRRGAQAIVFGASAAVLVLELLALRMLAPELGLTLETTSLVIGTCLAGIAIGAQLGGALADERDPRRLLGPLLAGGGVTAMLSLPLVEVPLVGVLWFAVPAALLSAVSPVAAKLRLGDLGEAGAVVGSLSASATAGALAGTFLTGFVLLGTLPNAPIVLGTGVLLVVAGVLLGAPRGPLLGAGAVAAALGALAGGRCDVDTAYFCARVEAAGPDERVLVLDDLRHAHVDLRDPRHLEFRYVQLLAAALPPGRLEALHLGGGGFTLPRYVLATRPGSRNVVLEVDEDVVALARDELGLRTGPGLVVRTGDARRLVREEPTGRFDVVVGDAFGALAVPWHLTTREFLADVRRTLRPGGLYAMNLIDRGGLAFARAQAATLAGLFRRVAVLGAPDGGNLVLLASDAQLPEVPLRAGEVRRDGRAWARGVRALTDAYAPVDRLHTGR